MRLSVSFIVIAHHNGSTLSACLDSVETQSTSNDELILVLNNPDAQTKSVASNRPKWIVVNETSPGPQFARNCGAKFSSKSLLCFFDADILVGPDWIEMMLKNFENPWVAMGQSRIHQIKTSGLLNTFKRYRYIKFNSHFYLPSGRSSFERFLILDTAAMMVRKEWFDKVGGFDPEFFRLEDSDFSLRVMYFGGDFFFEDRVSAQEMDSPEEGLINYIHKEFQSAKLMPLYLKKHLIPYAFPFSGPDPKKIKIQNLKWVPKWAKCWDYLQRAIHFFAAAKSPHQIEITHKYYFKFGSAPKRLFLDSLENPDLRIVWVGGKKRVYDLTRKVLSKPQEQ